MVSTAWPRLAGVLAAAGLIALEDGPALLKRDHERAKTLAIGLSELPWAHVDVAATESNICMLEPGADSVSLLLTELSQHGILASEAGFNRIRFVLHRDIDDEAVGRCLNVCRQFSPS